jgi:hypothetical protein
MHAAGWTRTGGAPGDKSGAEWTHRAGWRLRHCGHPTAVTPWALFAPSGEMHCTGARAGNPKLGTAWPDLRSAVEYVQRGPTLPPPPPATRLQCRRDYMTTGNPMVAAEPVRVLRRAPDLGEGWYVVRFLEGASGDGRVCMHVSSIDAAAPVVRGPARVSMFALRVEGYSADVAKVLGGLSQLARGRVEPSPCGPVEIIEAEGLAPRKAGR